MKDEHGERVLTVTFACPVQIEVAPILAAQGCRVVVPYLRGFGPTQFVDADTPRSGEQAALAADLLALLGALDIPVLQLGAAASLEDSYTQLETLGTATGHADDAEKVVTDQEAEIEQMEQLLGTL